MKTIIEILTIIKKHINFVALYFLMVIVVSVIFCTEATINQKMSLSGYCLLISIIALAYILEGKSTRKYDEGYENGKLDSEIHWKAQYMKIIHIIDNGYLLPIKINDNFKILAIEKTGEQIFFDTTWEITGIYNGNYFTRRLTRTDGEHLVRLAEVLKATNCPADITELDESKKINYA